MDNNNDMSKEIMRKARAKYLRDKVDTIALRVPKGQKENIRSHEQSTGESVHSLINRAIFEAIRND